MTIVTLGDEFTGLVTNFGIRSCVVRDDDDSEDFDVLAGDDDE